MAVSPGKVRNILDKMCPLKKFRFAREKPAWMTDELIEIIKDRDRALKRTTITKSQRDVAHVRQVRNLTNTVIKSARAEFIKSQLDLKQKDPKGLRQLRRSYPITSRRAIVILA